eukprot:NODE_5106_length_602_cov_43.041591_g4411_i0.p2 GENE.NODE_5106_length_602_cov_43.041591_g4411_i0~~NODE_5106_length_602_cov_43.041591_g4411_i0.p2  ORF type:complete len:85 (+),score=15.99 NODE_5106_length_602_cov_43.041591_g4411_i0:280-534(+)
MPTIFEAVFFKTSRVELRWRGLVVCGKRRKSKTSVIFLQASAMTKVVTKLMDANLREVIPRPAAPVTLDVWKARVGASQAQAHE